MAGGARFSGLAFAPLCQEPLRGKRCRKGAAVSGRLESTRKADRRSGNPRIRGGVRQLGQTKSLPDDPVHTCSIREWIGLFTVAVSQPHHQLGMLFPSGQQPEKTGRRPCVFPLVKDDRLRHHCALNCSPAIRPPITGRVEIAMGLPGISTGFTFGCPSHGRSD